MRSRLDITSGPSRLTFRLKNDELVWVYSAYLPEVCDRYEIRQGHQSYWASLEYKDVKRAEFVDEEELLYLYFEDGVILKFQGYPSVRVVDDLKEEGIEINRVNSR